MSERPWSDGNLLAIAWYATTSFATVWSQLAAHDEELDRQQLTDLLQRVTHKGFPAGPDTPPDLMTGGAIEAELDELVELLGSVRAAVAAVFTEPGALGERIWATCQQPRVHMTLATAKRAGVERVELLHLGDLTRHSPDWQQRGLAAHYSALQVLAMAHAQLGPGALAIELERLPVLRSLDLSQNAFETIPGEVLDGAALEELYLDENPLHDISALHDPAVLPRLTYLGVSQTDLTDSDLERLTAARPNLTVDHW